VRRAPILYVNRTTAAVFFGRTFAGVFVLLRADRLPR
jgi:hypothetical protein